MSDATPFPRSSLCGNGEYCVGDGTCHIYETDLSLNKQGKTICGACTRAANKRRGPDLRSIIRNFRWRAGHDPADDEATPESGFEYHTLEPSLDPLEPNQRDQLKGGPPAGVNCINCKTRGSTVELRIARRMTVAELLNPLGWRPSEGLVAPREGIYILVCPRCGSVVHWRESLLEKERSRARR